MRIATVAPGAIVGASERANRLTFRSRVAKSTCAFGRIMAGAAGLARACCATGSMVMGIAPGLDGLTE